MVDWIDSLDQLLEEYLDHDNGTEQELAYCAAIVYPWSHYVWNQASDLEVEELKKEITQLLESDDRFSDFASLVENCGDPCYEEKKDRGGLVGAVCVAITRVLPTHESNQVPYCSRILATEDGSWRLDIVMHYVYILMHSPLWPIISKCTIPARFAESKFLDEDNSDLLFRCITANSPVRIERSTLKPTNMYFSDIQRWFFEHSTLHHLYIP